LSLILNQIGNLDASQETVQSLTAMYREKALDTFVRGLNGNLAQLLTIKEGGHLCYHPDSNSQIEWYPSNKISIHNSIITQTKYS